MTAPKPATPFPVNRHFDCMKRCPMDCANVCKRLMYPQLQADLQECREQYGEREGQYAKLVEDRRRLVEALRGTAEELRGFLEFHGDRESQYFLDYVDTMLRELGEA